MRKEYRRGSAYGRFLVVMLTFPVLFMLLVVLFSIR